MLLEENLVNFVHQSYKVDFLIINTIVQEQYNALCNISLEGAHELLKPLEWWHKAGWWCCC